MNKRELRKWRDDYTPWDGQCITEGIRLAVHFDEKDHVKRIGARWAPDPSGKGGYWWMPVDKINGTMPSGVPEIVNTFDDKADLPHLADGQTRLEWLNNNMMVNGFHGQLHQEAALSAIEDVTAVEHHIRNPEDNEYGHFYVFADQGVVNWLPNGANPNYNHTLMTLEQGQILWQALMDTGYRLVLEESS